jgi:hypothetical protein
MAVVLSVYRDKSPDNSNFTEIGSESTKEAVVRTWFVVRSSVYRQPVL